MGVMLIDKIKSWLDDNLPSYPKGVSEVELKVLINSTDKLLNVKIPESFSNLLKEVNGFSCDGFSIYGVTNDEIKSKFKYLINNDLIAVNEKFRDSADTDDYLLFGKSSLNYIALDIRSGKYVLLSNAFLDIIREFDDFEALIETFLDI